MVEDISERKVAEQELHDQYHIRDAVLGSAPICVVRINDEGIITYAAGAGLRRFDIIDGQLEGSNIFEIWPNASDHIQMAINGEEVEFADTGEFEGESWGYQSWLIPGRISGVGAYIISADVTEVSNIRVEKARRETFSATISRLNHAINNALMVIQGKTQLAQKKNPEGPNTETFKQILQQVDTISEEMRRLGELDQIDTQEYANGHYMVTLPEHGENPQ